MDRLLESYRRTIRGKNGGGLSLYFLNVTVVAAWRIYCQLGQQEVSHLEFWRRVTLCLLRIEEEPRNKPDGEAELPQYVRFNKMNHFRRPTSQRRCKMCKKITKLCVKNAMYACMQNVASVVLKCIIPSNKFAPE